MRRKEYRGGFIVRSALNRFDFVPRTLKDSPSWKIVDAADTDFVGISNNRLVKWVGDLATGHLEAGPVISTDQTMGGDTSEGSDDNVPTEKAVKLFLKAFMAGFDMQESVLDMDLLTPPGSPNHGDGYLINGTGTGLWVGHDYDLAYWDTQPDPDEWNFITPDAGTLVEVEDENGGLGAFYYWTGSTWRLVPFLADIIKSGAIDPAETIKGATHSAIAEYATKEAVNAALVLG